MGVAYDITLVKLPLNGALCVRSSYYSANSAIKYSSTSCQLCTIIGAALFQKISLFPDRQVPAWQSGETKPYDPASRHAVIDQHGICYSTSSDSQTASSLSATLPSCDNVVN